MKGNIVVWFFATCLKHLTVCGIRDFFLNYSQDYGISNNLLRWFGSYLNCRSQRVLHRNVMSNFKCLQAGVPQRSVLGPLLFLIYVNDVAKNMSSFCRLYADDNSLQNCSTNIDSINNDLNQLDMWSKQWLLKFNPSKTTAVLFSNKKSCNHCLEFQNCKLEFVSAHKHLGIILSRHLSRFSYIDSILAKAYKNWDFLKNYNSKLAIKLYLYYTQPSLDPILNMRVKYGVDVRTAVSYTHLTLPTICSV